jgi:hypothetical protein
LPINHLLCENRQTASRIGEDGLISQLAWRRELGTTENFPKHDAAMAQGPNRFARAQFYLERGRAEAARLGVPCRWNRVVVPGVAHEGMRMSAFAGDYWFGGKS